MANEMQYRSTSTGVTIYAIVTDEAGQYWSVTNSAFEALVVANWGTFDITMTETPAASYFYVGDFPAAIATGGVYGVMFFEQAAGAPAITDTLRASGEIYWTDSAERDIGEYINWKIAGTISAGLVAAAPAPVPGPIHATIWEDSAATLMARVVGADGSYITQAGMTGISYKIFDLNSATPDTAIKSDNLVVANVVFDALQTDARWTEDATGYNFRWTQPADASVWATGGHRYRQEILFNPVAGDDFWLIYELYCEPVRTS